MSTRGRKPIEAGTARTVEAPRGRRRGRNAEPPSDPETIAPATREEKTTVLLTAVLLAFVALIVCFTRGYVLLYGDAVAHLGIARRILDSRNPGLVQLGGVWLPLPHLLLLPFVQKMQWWQSGLAGTWPSLAFYILGVAGFYRLCRRMLVPRWALLGTMFYALNPNLLYLATTAMTEPLFLALMIWMVLETMECVAALRAGEETRAGRRMMALGGLILAAVLTRYDGWVLGAMAWAIVARETMRAREMRARMGVPFAVLTLLAVAGPALWLGYNQHFSGDALDFLRGPYSAAAILKKTTPKGVGPYRGWHNPLWAVLFYTRTAQVDAAAWETGFVVMVAALEGLAMAWRRGRERVSVLLWVPLGFYVYSIAYGSVPLFIPQLWPHSYYNSRYGMELLPALALFACVAGAAIEKRMKARAAQRMVAGGENEASSAPRFDVARALFTTLAVLTALNPMAMIYGADAAQHVVGWIARRPSTALARYSPPLVLKEALANAMTRVPMERNLALVLNDLQTGVPILMAESAHIGALQDAGIPLKQTINETDRDSWNAALADPAGHAAYVVAFAGDEVAQAVAAHPAGLDELTVLCTTGQPCVRVYQSERYGAQAK